MKVTVALLAISWDAHRCWRSLEGRSCHWMHISKDASTPLDVAGVQNFKTEFNPVNVVDMCSTVRVDLCRIKSSYFRREEDLIAVAKQ